MHVRTFWLGLYAALIGWSLASLAMDRVQATCMWPEVILRLCQEPSTCRLALSLSQMK